MARVVLTFFCVAALVATSARADFGLAPSDQGARSILNWGLHMAVISVFLK